MQQTTNKTIMIMGCSSDAGKSLLTAGICRLLANKKIKVCPFKAQNMSNNAAVTYQNHEIGRAQYLQALAARTTPDYRMNPILLKPFSETKSQLILNGKVKRISNSKDWNQTREELWPSITKAITSLQKEYQTLVIEGAGSPAEINLKKSDLANMKVAKFCNADVYLVVDIDKGGAFSHLLGTYLCLDPEEQQLIKGFVINKFRGDQSLLKPAIKWITQRTQIPVVATIPWIYHHLPEEDSFNLKTKKEDEETNTIKIALILYPYAANLDEFDPLAYENKVNIIPVKKNQCLRGFDAIILPGSKNTKESLAYLHSSGISQNIIQAQKRGQRILGICAGLQILGKDILDPHSVDGGNCQGLGLLEIKTNFIPLKTVKQRTFSWRGNQLKAYEIHHGKSEKQPPCQEYFPEDLGFRQGDTYGWYLHGLFENSSFRSYFLKKLGWKQTPKNYNNLIDEELNNLATKINSLWQPSIN